MDGLKEINDTLGHDAGDRAIMEMAGALRKAFRSEDLVARLGGDEFAAVACDLVASDFPKVRERIGQALEEVNSRRDERFSLSISLGFVVFSREDRNLEHLLAVADGVLYEEKRRKHANP
jgi:diguanylate cyclase (GGDEF)-like protein